MRELDLSDWPHITERCYDIFRGCPSSPTFPKLRRISRLSADPNIARYLHYFFQPSLRSLSIHPNSRRTAAVTCDLLKASSRYLRTLEWEHDAELEIPWTADILSETVCHLHGLVNLSLLLPLRPYALAHLARLPDLQTLNIRLSDADLAEVFPRGSWLFPSLQHLRIDHAERLQPVVHLLNAIQPNTLRSLYVLHADPDVMPGACTERLLFLISKFTDLQTLNFRQDRPAADATPAILPGSSLAPLLRLTQLEALDLSDIALELGKADVCAFARAWPNISVLKLGNRAHHAASSVAFQDLAVFAERCPFLNTLGLVVSHPTIIPPSTAVQHHPGAFGPSGTHLKQLLLGRSELSEPEYIAAFLSHVFPHAVVSSHEPSEAAAHWEPTPNLQRSLDEINRLRGVFLSKRDEASGAA